MWKLRTKLASKFDAMLGGLFPERRVFLRSDDDTRYIRLRPTTQALIFSTLSLVLAWSIIATAILLMDSIGAGNFREQAKRDQETYQLRLRMMAEERDARATEAAMAQQRFAQAVEQVAVMQTELLQSEMRQLELRKGLDVVQTNLVDAIKSKRKAVDKVAQLQSAIDGSEGAIATSGLDAANSETVTFLTDALSQTASERDQMMVSAQAAMEHAQTIEIDMRLMQERNEQIFRQVEEAMVVSIKPLEKMFKAAGVNPDNLLSTVRKGYSGLGGPSLSMSTNGEPPSPEEARALALLKELDDLNVYRIAAQKLPVGLPIKDNFRFTSGYGRRWGRMHRGTDFAAAHGTPIYSTGDGVVVHAGWGSGYGRLVKIKHDFGLETRYAHLSRIRVKVGQKVSRGQRIGDMGNTGRSTGTHLHYEVRVNGTDVNPMTYIKAAKDVF